MKEFQIYANNKSLVLSNEAFFQMNLWGEELYQDEYDVVGVGKLRFSIFAPDDFDSPMSIHYYAYENRDGLIGWYDLKVCGPEGIFEYDHTKTLEENVKAAACWAEDQCDEMADDAYYEKYGPEKYFGAPALM